METKTLKEVHGLNPESEVVIKKFTAGDGRAIKSGALKISIGKGGQQVVDVDIGELQILTVERGIVSAPFINSLGNKRQAIDNLSLETFDYLFKAINDYNAPVSEEEKKS